MKKKKHINFLAVALLMLYGFGLAPSFVFHHHHQEVIAFSDADSCEKAIYYGVQDQHKEHISKSLEKCWLCDHHTITPEVLFDTKFDITQPEIQTQYTAFHKNFHSIEITSTSNKDPPLLA